MSIFSTDENDPRTWNKSETVKESVVEGCRESGKLTRCGGYLAIQREKDGKIILFEATDVIE